MDTSEIQAAIGGPGGAIVQPEGGSDVTPLPGHGQSGPGTQPFPATVEPQQGAGSTSGGLTPGASGVASDGTIHVGGNAPDSSTGPGQLPAVSGISALTAGGNFGANRPLDGTA